MMFKFVFVMTGGQTNLANLLSKHPESHKYFSQVVYMGGCVNYGNKTPVAEYNIYMDAEAVEFNTKFLFEKNIKFIMIPLDVTHVNTREIQIIFFEKVKLSYPIKT